MVQQTTVKKYKKTKPYRISGLWTGVMLIGTLVSGGGFYQVANATYPVIEARKVGMGDHPPLLDLPREVTNVVLLGQSALYDDLMVLWLVQYLGGALNTHRLEAEALEVVLRKIASKKIHHEQVYLASCFKLMMDLDKAWLCEDILALGIESVPDSWLIPAVLGKVHFDQEEFLKAAEMFKFAGNVPGAPEYIQSVSTTVLVKKDLGDVLKAELADKDSTMSAQSRQLFQELERDFAKRVAQTKLIDTTEPELATDESRFTHQPDLGDGEATEVTQHSAAATLARPQVDDHPPKTRHSESVADGLESVDESENETKTSLSPQEQVPVVP